MKKLLLSGIAALFLATGAAHAQSGVGPSGFFGPGTGYVNRIPSNSNVRPINISPSGRLYDTEAPTYFKTTPKVQRKSKRR